MAQITKMDEELKRNVLKTGTTILGIVCKDGLVMASDRQITAGQSLVVSKNYPKTVPLGDRFLISFTGIVSDAQRVPKILAAELRLKELKSKSKPTVRQAASLLSNLNYSGIRQPSVLPQQVGFLFGGVNEDGTTELYTVEPSGSVVKVEDYDANFGSGMPYVLGLLERQWKEGMSVREGAELAVEALKSSTQRDIGSGHGIDVFTITNSGIKKVVDQKIVPEYKNKK